MGLSMWQRFKDAVRGPNRPRDPIARGWGLANPDAQAVQDGLDVDAEASPADEHLSQPGTKAVLVGGPEAGGQGSAWPKGTPSTVTTTPVWSGPTVAQGGAGGEGVVKVDVPPFGEKPNSGTVAEYPADLGDDPYEVEGTGTAAQAVEANLDARLDKRPAPEPPEPEPAPDPLADWGKRHYSWQRRDGRPLHAILSNRSAKTLCNRGTVYAVPGVKVRRVPPTCGQCVAILRSPEFDEARVGLTKAVR